MPAFLSLLFTIPFTRHETDERYRNAAQRRCSWSAASLAVGSVIAGVFRPDFLAGPGLALALLGLGFLCAYLAQVDTSDGIGYTVAFALGVVRGAGRWSTRSAGPRSRTLLYDGPAALRKPNGALDYWKVVVPRARGARVPRPGGHRAVRTRAPVWLKGALALVGLSRARAWWSMSLINNPVHARRSRSWFPPGSS